MLTGAASGSTVSGVKLIRVIVLFKGIWWRITGLFAPETAVRRLRIGDRVLNEDEVSNEFEEAGIVVVLYLLALLAGLAVFLTALPGDVPLEYGIFEVMSAQSNVGLSAGITGPGMPTVTKISLMLNMWVGRLEIIPVLVLLRVALIGTEYP
jgi:trk system potassium uptake protein TrkH